MQSTCDLNFMFVTTSSNARLTRFVDACYFQQMEIELPCCIGFCMHALLVSILKVQASLPAQPTCNCKFCNPTSLQPTLAFSIDFFAPGHVLVQAVFAGVACKCSLCPEP